MQKQQINNIIFDFGCVIIKADFKVLSKKIAKTKEEEDFIYKNIFYSPEWMGLGLVDTGFLSFEALAEIINDRTNNSHRELVNKVLSNVNSMFKYNDNILELIRELKKKGYNLYMLSNISKKVYSTFRDDLKDLFDGLVLSYEIHKIKPYDGIYNYLIDKYNINPEQSLFIDDNEDNINASKKFNIISEKVHKNDLDDVKRVLKKWGCL